MRWFVVVVTVAACGRLNFDPFGDGGARPDTESDASFTGAQVAYLKASNTDANDLFGQAVAVSGDGTTLAVSAPNEGSAATGIDGNQADSSLIGAGAVYVFVRTGAWTQQAYVKASNTDPLDRFGLSLAISGDGNTLAVGAPAEQSLATGIDGNQADNSFNQAGAVYVFVRNGTTWSQQAYVKASNTGPDDVFGSSVAVSGDGNTLVVGAVGEASAATGIGGNQADNNVPNAGAVYVFTRSGTTWSQQAYVKGSNTGMGDAFGIVALSADGNTLAVGAQLEDSAAVGIDGDGANNSLTDAGAAYIFTRAGAVWSQQAYVKASNPNSNDWFARTIAVSTTGDTVAVGTPAEASMATGIDGDQLDNSLPFCGAVYLVARSGSTWSQTTYIKRSVADSLLFANSLAMAGDDLVAAGAPSGQGTSYLFSRASGTWTQIGPQLAPGGEASDAFGTSVAVSANGTTLVVGANGEDSATMGIDGDRTDNSDPASGAVYVFY